MSSCAHKLLGSEPERITNSVESSVIITKTKDWLKQTDIYSPRANALSVLREGIPHAPARTAKAADHTERCGQETAALRFSVSAPPGATIRLAGPLLSLW